MLGIKALFTYDYGKENMDSLKELGYDITIIGEKDISYCEDIKDTEVLVCYNPFNTLDIRKLQNLKWIQLSSIGVDQLPVEKAVNKGVIVTNNRGGYSIPMGEWVVLKILEMIKNSKEMYENQRKKIWKMDTNIVEIHGKIIGFIGTGTIAIESAKRLQGFDVNILGVNTSGRSVEYFNRCYSLRDIDDMLELCDVVVITIPSTDDTYKLINKERFSNMKNGAYLINVSRGNVIDEEALINNLHNKKIACAALDVFFEEPLSKDSPLWDLDNVIITAHNSWVSEKRNQRRFETIFENMKRYSKKEILMNKVDLNKGY